VEIPAQSLADFALTQAYNFQGTHILGASRGHLNDSVISLPCITFAYHRAKSLTSNYATQRNNVSVTHYRYAYTFRRGPAKWSLKIIHLSMHSLWFSGWTLPNFIGEPYLV